MVDGHIFAPLFSTDSSNYYRHSYLSVDIYGYLFCSEGDSGSIKRFINRKKNQSLNDR